METRELIEALRDKISLSIVKCVPTVSIKQEEALLAAERLELLLSQCEAAQTSSDNWQALFNTAQVRLRFADQRLREFARTPPQDPGEYLCFLVSPTLPDGKFEVSRFDGQLFQCKETVTHWMPLPPHP